jgi:hypothetical protein
VFAKLKSGQAKASGTVGERPISIRVSKEKINSDKYQRKQFPKTFALPVQNFTATIVAKHVELDCNQNRRRNESENETSY